MRTLELTEKRKKMATNNPPEDHSKKLEEKLETALAFKEEGNTLYKGQSQFIFTQKIFIVIFL